MDRRSMIWQFAAEGNKEEPSDAVTQETTVELSEDDPVVDSVIDLMAQFKGSVTTMLVLEKMQQAVSDRITKGEAYCKEHRNDLRRFKLLQSLYLEQATLETRIKLEAKIQGELEVQMCDVPNEYICLHCLEIHDRACQCMSGVA